MSEGGRSEQLVGVDRQDGLPPVTEGAELRHDKGLVLLLAQQREHVLHQLAQPAVSVERPERSEVKEKEQRAEREQTSLRVPPSAVETVGRQRKTPNLQRGFTLWLDLHYSSRHQTPVCSKKEVERDKYKISALTPA